MFWDGSFLNSEEKVRVEIRGGVLSDRLDLNTEEKGSLKFGEGVFWDRSDLNSEEKVRVRNFGRGECSGTGQF